MKQVSIVLLLVLACFAQKQPPASPRSQAQVSCGTSKGCATFAEMLRNNDPDFRNLTSADYMAFVCFVDKEDRFFVVGFDASLLLWDVDPERSAFERADGLFTFTDYQDGFANRSELETVLWRRRILKYRHKPEEEWQRAELSPKEKGKVVSINDAEVNYLTTFSNGRNEQVQYSMQIRRSTLRFQETFKLPAGNSVGDTGRCKPFGAAR
jgi:hypothetical protein